MKKLNVMGLPTIIFLNNQGNEIENSRVTGFMPADEFLVWLQRLPI